MATETKAMEPKKDELLPEASERTRDGRCFVPRSDIYETEDQIIIVMDMPGVQKDNIEISLEKTVLAVNGYADLEEPDGFALARAEYEVGDYERSFRISNQINRDEIEAEYKNGVLHLILPKTEEALKRKIDVKVG